MNNAGYPHLHSPDESYRSITLRSGHGYVDNPLGRNPNKHDISIVATPATFLIWLDKRYARNWKWGRESSTLHFRFGFPVSGPAVSRRIGAHRGHPQGHPWFLAEE